MSRRVRQRKQGQALIEMAIVMPVLIFTILGGLDFMQRFIAEYTINQAARVVAHQAALDGGNRQGRATASGNEVINGGIGTKSSLTTIQVACSTNPCRRYSPITVTITYSDKVWAPMPWVYTEFTVVRKAVRAAEQDQQ